MPSVEQRLTALEAASFTLTSEQQRLKADNDAYHANIDARLNSIADGLMAHRREVAARFDRVDEQFGRVDEQFGRVDERFGRVDERFGRVEGELADLKAGQSEMREMLARIVAKIDA
ncbi:hypothetical protein [Nocardiopsis composta]|uniref:Septation ring formation regulator EzrA n=1 Tax=Nocardiopsis composta TaxID=157465 RepID=A0A7W8VG66_9ACTN|nr:hypothetical protein [Nocardiopsis composta]MBB5434843.1 septation ring formation regulator EzrA [Nocardiopsis composta]